MRRRSPARAREVLEQHASEVHVALVQVDRAALLEHVLDHPRTAEGCAGLVRQIVLAPQIGFLLDGALQLLPRSASLLAHARPHRSGDEQLRVAKRLLPRDAVLELHLEKVGVHRQIYWCISV